MLLYWQGFLLNLKDIVDLKVLIPLNDIFEKARREAVNSATGQCGGLRLNQAHY